MIKQQVAQIYKSDSRTIIITKNLKRFTTIDIPNDSKNKTDVLQLVKEEVLLPNSKVTTSIEKGSYVIILPLFGGVDYTDNLGNEDFIRVEQMRYIETKKGMSFELCNPYEKEKVSYLQILLNAAIPHTEAKFNQITFDLTSKNQLITLFDTTNTLGFIGMYGGRKEGFYTLRNASNAILVFVINGAFEVENRLLESRDGLHIEQPKTLEWEALSENALLLILEIPSK